MLEEMAQAYSVDTALNSLRCNEALPNVVGKLEERQSRCRYSQRSSCLLRKEYLVSERYGYSPRPPLPASRCLPVGASAFVCPLPISGHQCAVCSVHLPIVCPCLVRSGEN